MWCGLPLLLAALACVAAAQTAAQRPEPVRVAGTRVSLAPPPGFVASRQFPGFAHEQAGASLMVTEMPAPLPEVLPALTDAAALARRGMTLLGKEQVRAGDRDALLLHVRQTAAGSEFLKWLLVVGDESGLAMVTATFPAGSDDALSSALRRSVLSARWDKGESIPTGEGLKYRVSEKGVMKLANRTGHMLAYTPGGAFPAKSVADPLFIVAPSISPLKIEDHKDFSEERIFHITSVIGIGVMHPSRVAVDGLSGYEITTTGRDKATDEPLTIYQVVLFDRDHYYLMQGLVGARHAAAHLKTFKEMARSFRRVPRAPARPGGL